MTELHHNLRVFGCLFGGIFLLSLAACQAEELEHPGALDALSEDITRGGNVSDEDVIVRVDGRAISSKEFELFWSEHADLGREEALDALIERELVLAAWAKGELEITVDDRRRQDIARDLQDARKRGMNKALLRREIEESGDIPPPEDAEVQRYIGDFFQREATPAGFRVTQLVIVPREGAGPDAWERAEKLIRNFDERFDPERDVLVQLQEMREEVVDEVGLVDGDLLLRMNRGITFKSSEADPLLDKPEGWLNVFPEVVSEVERIAKESKGDVVGARTPPIRSSAGWHIIRIDEVIKGQQPSPEETQAQVTRAHRRMVFAKRYSSFATPLLKSASFQLYPENLEEEAVQARKPSAKAKQ